jgi:uncharacterized protein RhaS with RHS repeats
LEYFSEDPIGFTAGDPNLYGYVGNSATLDIDPTGLANLWNPASWGVENSSQGWGGFLNPFSAENRKFFNDVDQHFTQQVNDGVKGLVTGDAGRALGERAVAISENQSGKKFTGTGGDYFRACRAIAGDMTGANSFAEGVGGYDMATQEELDAWERASRTSGGIGGMSGTLAGGLSAAGKFSPKGSCTKTGPYSHLDDHPSVGPGKDFTQSAKKKILAENRKKNNGVLRDDRTGEAGRTPQQSKKGVTPPDNEVHVDHVIPKSKGGTNSFSNAEVRLRKHNLKKGNKLE